MRHWVAVVTKVPAVDRAVVLLVIGVLAVPSRTWPLALPDNGSAEVGSPQRTTFDLIATEFGPGYNAPLLVTADIITSTDPKGTVQDLADDIAKIPGVAGHHQADPERDRAISVSSGWCRSGRRAIRGPPSWSGRIRAQAPAGRRTLKISDITVTGQTAVAIDVNSRPGRGPAAVRPGGGGPRR